VSGNDEGVLDSRVRATERRRRCRSDI
jgi:hypothetical protein